MSDAFTRQDFAMYMKIKKLIDDTVKGNCAVCPLPTCQQKMHWRHCNNHIYEQYFLDEKTREELREDENHFSRRYPRNEVKK